MLSEFTVLASLLGTPPCGHGAVLALKRPGDQFGSAICVLGDVDDDGTADWAASDPYGPGTVQVHSGATGRYLWELPSIDPQLGWGSELSAAGDFDKDGTGDIAIGCSPTTRATSSIDLVVVSGRDGKWLLYLDRTRDALGGVRSLAGGPDLDSDGVPDLVLTGVASIWAPDPAGVIEARSGRNGREIWIATRRNLGSHGLALLPETGTAVGTARSMATIRPNLHAELGEVQVVSALDGTTTWTWSDPRSVVVPHSIDGLLRENKPPLLAVAFSDDSNSSHPARLTLLLPGTSEPLWTRQIEEARGEVDVSVFGGSDLDGDGRRDVVLGCRDVRSFSGGVYAFDEHGTPLWVAYGDEESDLGHCFAGGCDLDRDGCDDLLVGAVCPYNAQEPGYVFALSGKTGRRLYRVGGH